MNNNEYLFAKSIVNLDENINRTMEYIKENFNVSSTYDEENNKMNLWVENVNEGLQLIAAKQYIEDTLGDYLVTDLNTDNSVLV